MPPPPGQFVPSERQTFVPPTVRLEVNAPVVPRMFVAKRPVPVAFVKFRVVKVEDPEAERVFKVVPWVTFKDVPVAPFQRRFEMFPFVAKRFVEVVFVPVAFVQVMFVGLNEVTLKVVAVRFEMKAFVVVVFPKTPFETKMLDPVAFVKFRVVTVVEAADRAPVRVKVVPVAFANVKFWRVVRPETARAAMLAVPVTVRFVVAMFTEVAFLSTPSTKEYEPVAVRFEVIRPPKRVPGGVADAPRWVTEARVSVSVYEGQFVPEERQTVVPPTVVFDGSW